jgi:hypothetical protein
LEKNSVESLRKTRITEDSEKLCQEGIEQVHRCTRTQNCERSVERDSARRASRKCAGRHRRTRELFEFWKLKEESTEGSSLGC